MPQEIKKINSLAVHDRIYLILIDRLAYKNPTRHRAGDHEIQLSLAYLTRQRQAGFV
jgi:hypothetical protein